MKPKETIHLTTLLLILQFVFIGLSLAGAIYVLANGGEPSAGYAVIPMLISLVFGHLYRSRKKRSVK